MERLTIKEICSYVNSACEKDGAIDYISTDSRDIKDHTLFVAIKGERFDGHHFIEPALRNGTVFALSENPSFAGERVIAVPNTLDALIQVAGGYRSKFELPIVAVTGSVGKTTTKEMIASVLSQKYNTIKTSGNQNNEIGFPKTIFRIGPDTQALVTEMGMSSLGDISKLAGAARPCAAAVITNIGVSHLSNLKTRENILKAKLEIIDCLDGTAPLILNQDNDLLSKVTEDCYPNILTISLKSKQADFFADEIAIGQTETRFSLHYRGKKVKIKLPCCGEHNIYNAMAAFCVGIELGISQEQCAQGLLQYSPAGMRQKQVEVGGIHVIEDCYNASPDSMEAALKTLGMTKDGKRIAVLADMLELGELEKEAHLAAGVAAANNGVDILYCYGDLSAFYIQGAQGVLVRRHFEDKEKLAQEIAQVADKGDTILFKGSRGMKLEDVIERFYQIKAGK